MKVKIHITVKYEVEVDLPGKYTIQDDLCDIIPDLKVPVSPNWLCDEKTFEVEKDKYGDFVFAYI